MLDIYGTLGPRCSDTNTLEAMFRAGMTGVRLNLSHISLPEAADQIRCLHEAAARCGKTAKLLVDMQGPELRIGKLPQPLYLENGSTAFLSTVTLPAPGNQPGRQSDVDAALKENIIPVPVIILDYLLPGQQLLMDDGKLLLEVTDKTENGAFAKILRGGMLSGRKSVALPGTDIHPETMTDADKFNISLAAQYGVTGVMQPFVRDREDLKTVRNALNAAGAEHIRLFAKIENMDGVRHLDELIPECEEIVIARGDLGNAVPLWELPRVQKEIEKKCLAADRAFMVVTQMLSSMERSPVPTRAEVSDIFNAVNDGASSVMVTGETAVGQYPVEVIRYLANTAREGLNHRNNNSNINK